MIVARVNPHRLSLTSPFKTKFIVEVDRLAIRHQYVLMKVTSYIDMSLLINAEPISPSLIVWMNQQMGIVHN